MVIVVFSTYTASQIRVFKSLQCWPNSTDNNWPLPSTAAKLKSEGKFKNPALENEQHCSNKLVPAKPHNSKESQQFSLNLLSKLEWKQICRPPDTAHTQSHTLIPALPNASTLAQKGTEMEENTEHKYTANLVRSTDQCPWEDPSRASCSQHWGKLCWAQSGLEMAFTCLA